MPSCAALLALALTAPSVVSQKGPANPAQAHDEAAIRSMSVAELLVRQAPEPFVRVAGEWTLRPETAELRRRAEGGLLSLAEWQLAIVEDRVIHTRNRWPQGEPLIVWVKGTAWLPGVRIIAEAQSPDIGTVEVDNMFQDGMCGLGLDAIRDRQRSLAFAPLPPEIDNVDLEVTIYQEEHQGSSTWSSNNYHRLWKGPVRLPVAAVRTIEEAMPSSSRPEELTAIKKSVRAWYGSNQEGARPDLCITVGGPELRSPSSRGLAASFNVELRRGDVLWATQPLVTSTGWQDVPRGDGLRGYCQFDAGTSPLSGPDPDPSGWDLRFVSSSKGVLPIWGADRWWKGSFTIPLSELLQKRPSK